MVKIISKSASSLFIIKTIGTRLCEASHVPVRARVANEYKLPQTSLVSDAECCDVVKMNFEASCLMYFCIMYYFSAGPGPWC